MVTGTLSFGAMQNRVRKLADQYPEYDIVAENKDGSIMFHLPLSWVRLSPPRKLSVEQRAAAAERLAKVRNHS